MATHATFGEQLVKTVEVLRGLNVYSMLEMI